MQIVGTPIEASGVSDGGLMTRRTSKRKKKYHSGRGVYVVVVGSTFGPSSAPRPSDLPTVEIMTTTATREAVSGAPPRPGPATGDGEPPQCQDPADDRHERVLGDGVGEERLALRLQDRVLAEVGLLLAGVPVSSLRRAGSVSADR